MSSAPYIEQPEAAATAIQYAQDVLSGSIVSCKYVKLSCQRFLDDIQNATKLGIYFDEDSAKHAVDFFGFLRHTKGIWAKSVDTSGFILSPWQVFIIANLFGWKRIDNGQRRFREAHIEVARKNGKSTFVAGIGLYMLFADGEPGAEVYSAATTKDQAKIVFGAAKDMVKVSPFLNSRIGSYRNNLHVDALTSKFEPLASDSNTLDGLNIHCALIDELHEHPTRALYDVLNTATGSRSQPLILAITTAGFNREGICWDQRTYGIKILAKIIPDEHFFVFIATLDDGDDWQDEKNWPKANPNIGVSISLEALRPNYAKAKEQPAAQNEFLRKHLNVWTSQDTAWLTDGTWEKNCAAGEHGNPVTLFEGAYERLKGRRCFGGLDLAEVGDVNAFALVFPPCDRVVHATLPAGVKAVHYQGEVKILPDANVDGLLAIGAAKLATFDEIPVDKLQSDVVFEADPKWSILVWFWIPDAFIEDRIKKNRAPYDAWIRGKFIVKTDGNAVDQESIRNKILELHNHFRMGEVGYDSWGADWIAPKLLKDGIKMVKIPQRFEHMSNPTKNLTSFLVAGICEHFNNPVMRWMASNVQLLLDSTGSQRPDKGKSRNKIDGIVATVMAIGRALANPVKGLDDPKRYAVRYI